MIENALIFALGALSSALIALVVFPAFTRRAAKLARRRLEAELPRSLVQIAALKDGVRAELAAKTAKVEAELMTAREAIVAERLARASGLRDVQSLQAERRGLQISLAETENRLEAVRADLRGRDELLVKSNADRREMESRLAIDSERMKAAEADVQRAERATSEARVALAALDARSISLSSALDEIRKERDALEARALAAEAKLAEKLADTAGASITTGSEAADALIKERRQLVEENSQLRRERDRYRLAIVPTAVDLPKGREDSVRSLTDAMAEYRDGKAADNSARISSEPAASFDDIPAVTLTSVETGRDKSDVTGEQDKRVDALVRGLSHLRQRKSPARPRLTGVAKDGDPGNDREAALPSGGE